MQQKSWGSALLSGKCPACREGDIFTYPLKRITHFAEMNKNCPHCTSTLEPEPGFYFGAMFVSYALSVILFVVMWTALYVFWNPSDLVYVVVIGLGAILFTPISFRVSRVLFLYWFGGLLYKPSK
ncbi:MAG: DUF983 domain-containing protein [Bacteroidia bacterium]